MTTAKVKPRMCNCLEKLNKRLESGNTVVATRTLFNFKTGKTREIPTIVTEKRDPKKREKARTCVPTYCPFCGKKYPKD